MARIALARLALLGAAATAFQTLFSRAFLAAFGGDEAVLAALLGAWLVAGALGAAAARGWAATALLSFGPLAGAGLVLARALPAAFPAGAAPGTGAALLAAALLAGPGCAAAGAGFALLARDAGGGRAYLAEALGAAAAGAAFPLLLLGRAPDLALAAGAVLAASAAGVLGAPRRAAALGAAAGLAAAALLAAPPLARWTLAVQGPWLAGAEERPSASSSIVVSRASGDLAVHVDRAPVAAGADPAGAEEVAHLALALHPAPRAVAVVGVPPPGAFAELRRHGAAVEAIVPDEGLLAALREASPEWRYAAARAGDARRLLSARAGALDAVLIVAPPPTSAASNRTFTAEFLAAARAALAPGGLVAVALPGHAAAASEETRRLHSSLARTLEAALGPVRVLPAGRTVYLAGRDGLPAGPAAAEAVSRALAERGIAPVHLRPAVLAELLSAARSADAVRWSSLRERPNRDLAPTTYRLALARALAQAGDLGAPALLLLAGAVAAGLLLALRPRERPVEVAVAASGASALALQLVLLLLFQIGTGALYRELGLLVAGFMAGAALGAALGGRGGARRWLVGAALGQAALAVALALLAPAVAAGGPAALPAAVAAAGLAGLLPGAQFAAASRALAGARAAGALWAADLAGAALAALVTFTFAVPALGVRGTLLAAAALQAASAVLLLLPRRAPAAAGPSIAGAPALPAAFAALVILAALEATQLRLYALAAGRPWRAVAVVALVAALAAAARGAGRARDAARLGAGRLAAFAALAPAAAFPAARCFFQVPFLFCHACPRPCPFGWLRPYAVPAALLANAFDRRFCARVCPVGTVQAACALASGRPSRRIPGARTVRWAVLAFTAVGYLAVEAGRDEGVLGSGLYALLYRNAWAPSAAALAATAAILLAAFRWRRPFCVALCPIGAASALLRRGEDRLVPLRGPAAEARRG